MATLKQIIKEEVEKYAGRGANVKVYALLDDERQIYGIAGVGYPERRKPALMAMLVRLVDDKVIIEEDRTDKPLADALLERGIPRSQIILAYAGETLAEKN